MLALILLHETHRFAKVIWQGAVQRVINELKTHQRRHVPSNRGAVLSLRSDFTVQFLPSSHQEVYTGYEISDRSTWIGVVVKGLLWTTRATKRVPSTVQEDKPDPR